MHNFNLEGCVIVQAARHWLLTKETWIESWVPSSEIRGGKSRNAACFSEFFGFSLLSTIPPLLHIDLSTPCLVSDDPDQHYH
jgi:hypothetical protein